VAQTEQVDQAPSDVPAEERRRERAVVIHEGLPTQLPDIDPDETGEWIDSLDALIDSLDATLRVRGWTGPDEIPQLPTR